MPYRIQKITKPDLLDIVEFYRRIHIGDPSQIKGYEELQWLFADPGQAGDYHGFIARKESGEVAGIIGYTLSNYGFGEKQATGVIPMSWLVSPKERGILGVQLLLKVMRLGDFGFAIHGSESAIKTYGAVKLKLVARAHVYFKVTNFFRYIISENPLSLKTWFKAFYYIRGKRTPPDLKGFTLEPYQGEPKSLKPAGPDLTIVPTNSRNRWIETCPVVDSIILSLSKNGKVLGTCISYMEHSGYKHMRGKIVQVPYLGNDVEAYSIAINLMELELRNMGCTSISVMANHSALCKALKVRAYKTSDRKMGTRIFVRDPKGILQDTNLSEWFLTYYESDKGYRI